VILIVHTTDTTIVKDFWRIMILAMECIRTPAGNLRLALALI